MWRTRRGEREGSVGAAVAHEGGRGFAREAQRGVEAHLQDSAIAAEAFRSFGRCSVAVIGFGFVQRHAVSRFKKGTRVAVRSYPHGCSDLSDSDAESIKSD